jgi:predicted nucleic acid-binding protein
MALRATYLADKSALARLGLEAVARHLVPLLEEGLVATCAIIDLEVLYSARSGRDYEAILAERCGFEDVPITPDVMRAAVHTQRRLARRGQHRVPIPDLIIAAVAASASLTLLHYDADFEQIAAVTGQRHQWVAPRGSL